MLVKASKAASTSTSAAVFATEAAISVVKLKNSGAVPSSLF